MPSTSAIATSSQFGLRNVRLAGVAPASTGFFASGNVSGTQGDDALVGVVIHGKGAMPPRAGKPGLSDGDIKAAVECLENKVKWRRLSQATMRKRVEDHTSGILETVVERAPTRT